MIGTLSLGTIAACNLCLRFFLHRILLALLTMYCFHPQCNNGGGLSTPCKQAPWWQYKLPTTRRDSIGTIGTMGLHNEPDCFTCVWKYDIDIKARRVVCSVFTMHYVWKCPADFYPYTVVVHTVITDIWNGAEKWPYLIQNFYEAWTYYKKLIRSNFQELKCSKLTTHCG